MGLLANRDAY